MENEKIKILAIDDNPDNLISLKALIKESFPDALTITATNGQKGIELATSENPDVILLDMVMPGMDGFEVCKKIKSDKKLSDIPIVFVTALKGDKESRIRALEVGGEAFLAKPIDESELTAQIRAMVKIKNANLEKFNKEKQLTELVEAQTRELNKTHQTNLILIEDLKKENDAKKKSLLALKESEYFFKESQKAASIGSYQANFITGFWKSSEALDQIFGIDQSYIKSVDGWLDLIYQNDKEMMNLYLTEEVISKRHPFNKEYRIKRKSDGEIRWVQGFGKVDFDSENNFLSLTGTIQDITERKRDEEKLIKFNRVYSLISQINNLILRSHDREKLFSEVCSMAITYGKFQMSWIGIVDHETHKITPVAWDGVEQGYLRNIKNISIEDIPEGRGPTGKAVREGKTIVCNDIATDPIMKPWCIEAIQRGYNSSISIPIKVQEEIMGVFTLYSDEPNFFLIQEEVELLEKIVQNLSFSLEKTLNDEAHKFIEAALRESEQKYRLLAENVKDVIWVVDPITMRFLYISPSIESVLGYTPEEMMRMNFSATILPEMLESFLKRTRRKVENLLAKREPDIESPNEIVHLHKNGTLIYAEIKNLYYLNETTGKAEIQGISRDITERKLAEKTLRDSETRFRVLFENSSDAMMTLEFPSWQFSTGNTAAIRMFMAKDEAEFISQKPWNLSPELQPDGKPSIQKAKEMIEIAIRDGSHFFEWAHKRINGEDFLATVNLTKMEIAGKTILHGTVRDITEQKRAEEDRNKMVSEILKHNKSLEQYAYIISHNLRAPVANIIGLNNLTKLDTLTEEEKEICKQGLSNSVNKLDEVVKDLNQILNVKNMITEKKDKVVFLEITNEIISSIQNIINEEKVKFILNFKNNESMLVVRTYLYSIFYNLISNSIKYRQPDIEPVIEISSSLLNGHTVLRFKDNGLGIDLKNYSDEVFGLYKRFHTKHAEGKGMGLFMVKSQVESLGGKISISSEPNHGTEFTIEFGS